MRAAAREKGSIPVLQKNWDRVKRMVLQGQEQILQHREASNAFTKGKPEQTLVWEDDHGITCRARLDWLHDSMKIIDDYKTTGMSVNPDVLGRMMVSQGWEVQAAFYCRGIRKLTGQVAEFRFFAQETSEPHALSIIGVGPDFQWNGEWKVQKAIDLWAECLDSGKWPGWTDRIAYPLLPAWESSKTEADQLKGVTI